MLFDFRIMTLYWNIVCPQFLRNPFVTPAEGAAAPEGILILDEFFALGEGRSLEAGIRGEKRERNQVMGESRM